MPTAVRSHAKINLGLYIGAPRADGFHGLATVYQTLEMHDVVTVTARPAGATSIRITSNDARVPTDRRNTAWKMISLVLEELGVKAEVEIHIEKRLPVQGGLGAGSANAVAALVGLERELDIQQVSGLASQRVSGSLRIVKANAGPSTHFGAKNAPKFAQDDISKTAKADSAQDDKSISVAQGDKSIAQDETPTWEVRRLELAAQVGSDVPLFLVGGTVLGVDRGQEVQALPDLEPIWCVIAVPGVGVSTPQAFRDWDALCAAEGLTQEASTDKLKMLSRAYVSAISEAIPVGEQGAGSSGVLSFGEDLAEPQGFGLVRTGITSWIQNDFERVVFPQHPSLGEIKRLLAAAGTPEAALHASLSGSGSALFGLYQTRGDAEAAVIRVKQVDGVEARITRTLPRAAYWRQMLLQ